MRMPVKAGFTRSLRHREINKEILDSLLVDDMEHPDDWRAGGLAQISLTKERCKDGVSSLRFETVLRDEERIRQHPGRSMMGSSEAILRFARPRDWSAYNRIALRVYVHPTDVRVHTFYLRFTCIDAPASITDPKYATVIQGLIPGQWNYVLWEIPNLRRDRVTDFRIVKLLTGCDSGGNCGIVYDFDRLQLQRVEPEKYAGWEVAPGRIAYNHLGYSPEQPKRAFCSDLSVTQFQIRNAESGEVILTAPVREEVNARGEFQVLDFSEIDQPGRYIIETEDRSSEPFVIADTSLFDPIRKALNFYYVLRCGCEVPGVHTVCHADWQGIYDGEKRVINGGWHDAADFSQGSFRTGMSVYAMLELLQRMEQHSLEPELRERILEEALWGLDWLLKTRFGDGNRVTWNPMSLYTDGILGTDDDIVTPAYAIPWENFIAAATEALACRVLKETRPGLAEQCLQAAEEDWRSAQRQQNEWLDNGQVVITGDEILDNRGTFSHRWFSGGTYLTLSWGVISAIQLYGITGDRDYADRAVAYGNLLVQCQQQEFPDGIPLTGFFYTDPQKLAIVHHRHAAFEESPLLALSVLCSAFPDHGDWMRWYSAITLHSEYFQKRGAQYSTPYDMLPAAVFRKSDFEKVADPDLREAMLRQFMEGTRLSDEYRLRLFPIWTTRTHHGNTAVQLSHTLALTIASLACNDLESAQLAEKQMQWIFGGNPFVQSLMYGVGHDYMTLYGYNPGDVVGALPVGIDCVQNDEPYWSGSNYATYKEIWVVPVSRFLWNAAYLAMPARITGKLEKAPISSIDFVNSHTGKRKTVTIDASGNFEAQFPAGEYELRTDYLSRKMTLLPGGDYSVVLNPENEIGFIAQVVYSDIEKQQLRIRVIVEGTGNHELSIRLFNGSTPESQKLLTFQTIRQDEFDWVVEVRNPAMPWVAVIVPDSDICRKVTITGTLENR